MYRQVFLGFLSFYLAQGSSSYYVNGDTSPDQQFFYGYQPQSVQYYPNELNRPVFYPQLGMSPQYHDLVYNYIKGFAGTESPAQVNTFQPNIIYNSDQYTTQEIQNFGVSDEDKVVTDGGVNVEVNEQTTDKPGLNDYLLPSDIFTLNNHPKEQLYGNFDAIKMKKTNANIQSTSIPPLGGVVSNYVLLRAHSNPENLLQFPGTVKHNEAILQHIKRQIPDPDNSDGVVILAEPSQNAKTTEEEQPKEEDAEGNKEEEQMDAHPGIAQSKPSAIALAGPGGVAQASPVGTALVGQGGLAVAAPSGTAVAGPAGQGALPIQIGSNEKQQQKPTEKNEESDSY